MIELALLPQHLQLEPGGLTRATITLHAADAVAATYGLQIHGLDGSWYTLSASEVPVASPSDGQAVLTLHPPLEAGRGVYPFELTASHPDDPAMSGRIEALLVIEAEQPVATALATVPVAAMPLSRRSTLIALAALAALLLCAGAVYGLSKRSGTNRATSPRCTSSSVANCTPTPAPTGAAIGGHGGASPTPDPRPTGLASGAQPTPRGTAPGPRTPTTGSLPGQGSGGTHPMGTATAAGTVTVANPAPATSPISPPPLSVSITPTLGLTFPGLPDSPAHPGRGSGAGLATPARAGTPIGSPSTTETATATGTVTVVSSATPIATLTPTLTPLATAIPQPTATATARPTATTVPTFSPIPTIPPTATATVPPTATPTASATAGNSPTPAIVRLQYSYEIVDNQFTLKWLTENATGLAVDGQLETVPSGAQSYPLQTHAYEVIASGADGSRQIKVVAVVVVGDCEVTVNGQPTTVQSEHCRLLLQSQTRPSPTATIAPTLTPVSITQAASPTALPSPAIPANAFPTETPAVTFTPAASDTPSPPPSPSPFPTDTPSPAPPASGQDTPVGGT